MSTINKKLYAGLLTVSVILALTACKQDFEKETLGTIPKPDFVILPGADANSIILVNKTPGPSIPFWKLSTGQKLSGDSAKARLIFAGNYSVQLVAATHGGLDSVTKSFTIAASDPNACDPTHAIGFIASCTQKKWKLNPAASAYAVGPGPDNGSWWSNNAGDVTARSCEFDDEYTFTFNAAGTFNYDNKGGFYADGYIGSGSNGCEPNSNLNAAQAPWASGSFTYTVIDGAGINGLGQLKVNGLGAHIGLQKVHNGGETTSGPVGTTITYDILQMTRNVGGAGYDILKLGVNIGGDAWWTFTLRSY